MAELKLQMGVIMNWLNANQGFVMALLTLVYVVATVFMAGLMVRSNRLTRRQLDEQRSRPAVIFNILSRGSSFYAVLKNHGPTPAYAVSVSCAPPLVSHLGGKDMETALTAHPVSFLPPQQELADFIDFSPEFCRRYPEPIFTGKVQYKDSSDNLYTQDFRIDLTVLENLKYLC